MRASKQASKQAKPRSSSKGAQAKELKQRGSSKGAQVKGLKQRSPSKGAQAKELKQRSPSKGAQAKELKQRSSSEGGVCTLCNRALRMALKEHSKESRGVLGKASKASEQVRRQGSSQAQKHL